MNEKRLPPRLMVSRIRNKIRPSKGFQYTKKNPCPFSTTISWSRF